MRMSSSLIFGGIFFSIIGCQLLNSNSEEFKTVAQIQTGSQEYELTDTTLIDLSIKNIFSSPIYYNNCDSRTIEEEENGKVTESAIFMNPCECICIAPIRPNKQKKFYINGYFIFQLEDKLKLSKSVKYKIFPHF